MVLNMAIDYWGTYEKNSYIIILCIFDFFRGRG